MSQGSFSIAPPSAEIARQTIESALVELSQLAARQTSAQEFWPLFLQKVNFATSALASGLWQYSAATAPQVVYVSREDRTTAWFVDDLAEHSRMISDYPRREGTGTIVVEQVASSTIVFVPLGFPEATHTLELVLRPNLTASSLDGYLQIVQVAKQIADEHLIRSQLTELVQANMQRGQLLSLSQQLTRRHGLREISYTLANETRRILGCDRATVLIKQRRSARAIAVSGVEAPARTSHTVIAMEDFAAKALSQEGDVWSDDDQSTWPPQLIAASEHLIEQTQSRHFAILPQRVSDEAESHAAICCEWFIEPPSQTTKAFAAQLAQATSVHTERALQEDNIPFAESLRQIGRWRQSGSLRLTSIVAALVLIAIVAVALVPVRFNIEASGQLLPQRRQHVFAPVDGIVVQLPDEEEARFAAGQTILRLENRDLDLRVSSLAGKLSTLREELAGAQTEFLLDARQNDTQTNRSLITARVEQLKQQVAGIEAQLELSHKQRELLDVRSPMDGIVLTWDVLRNLSDRPVQRGELLLTLADPNGPWELQLNIPDREAGHVQSAFKSHEKVPVEFFLSTSPGQTFHGRLRNLPQAIEIADDGKPAQLATIAELDVPADMRRPRAVVKAKIDCGKRTLGYVWLRKIWELTREALVW